MLGKVVVFLSVIALMLALSPRTATFLTQRLSAHSRTPRGVRPLQASANGMSDQKNILGGKLEPCADGCGFYRDGFCRCLWFCALCHACGDL